MDEAVKKAVRFWDDRTNIETREVGYTCERCFLLGCNELAVEPAIDRGDVDSTQQTADMAALATAVRTRRAQQQDATPRRAAKGAVRPPAARQPAATAGAKRALRAGPGSPSLGPAAGGEHAAAFLLAHGVRHRAPGRLIHADGSVLYHALVAYINPFLLSTRCNFHLQVFCFFIEKYYNAL